MEQIIIENYVIKFVNVLKVILKTIKASVKCVIIHVKNALTFILVKFVGLKIKLLKNNNIKETL